jgi:hypothetical protein
MLKGTMDPTSLETVSRWASAAAVVLSVLAAIAITIAAYASSRVLAVTNARTEQVHAESARAGASPDAKATEAESTSAAAAPAVARELESDDRLPDTELARTTGSTPASVESPVAAPLVAGTREATVSVLQTALSPPQVEISWVAASDSYARAREIGSALEEAGWTVTQTGSVLIPSTPGATSITAGTLSDGALLLRKALETSGVKLSIVFDPTMPPDRVRLMIGNDQ